jgi:hypothetical protein
MPNQKKQYNFVLFQDELKTLEEIFTGLKELDKGYDVNDGNSNMLYIRSLIYLYLGKN